VHGGYSNPTVDADVLAAASSPNSTAVAADYSQITSLRYSNYSEIWRVVPTSFAVYSTSLEGVVENPMGSAPPASLLLNTLWAPYSGPYGVTFEATGLPSGTPWSVTLNGSGNTSATARVGFEVRNGTYAFTVGAVAEYTANRSSGLVNVTGAAVTIPPTFVKTLPVDTTDKSTSGLSLEDWWIVAGGAVVGVGALAVVLVRRSYPGTPPHLKPPPGAPPPH